MRLTVFQNNLLFLIIIIKNCNKINGCHLSLENGITVGYEIGVRREKG